MAEVSVRDLRNHGREVLGRVIGGEVLTVTRDGEPVAQLAPVPRKHVPPAELISRRRNLPRVDPEQLRRDLDDVIDPGV